MSMLALSLALAQATTVTLRAPAQTVTRALAAVAAASKANIVARGPIANDVVVLSVKDVPLDDLLKRIALATTGAWQREGDAYVLVRDDTKAREQEKAEVALQGSRFAARMQDYVKPLQQTPNLTTAEAEKRLQALAKLNEQVRQNINSGLDVNIDSGGTPQERLMARVMGMLEPKDLAALAPDSRTVFSTAPTRMQRQLPSGATQALGAFASEYAIWQAVAERYKPTDPESQFVDFGSFGAMKTRPTRLVLIATKWGEGLSVSLELKVVDDRGRVLSSTSAGIDAVENAQPKESQTAPANPEKPIALSKESIEVLAFRAGMQNPNLNGISPGVREKLLKPEENDPLTFGPSELLLGIADADGKNLVASVPDSTFDLALGTTGTTPSRAKLSLEAGETMKFADDGNWTMATPAWPAAARKRNVQRYLLGQFVRDLERPGAGSLDALAKLAVQAGGTSAPSLAIAYISMLQPAVATNLDYSSWDLLKFYGLLTPTQKAAIGPQNQLKIGSLENGAIGALTRLMFFGASAMPLGSFQEQVEAEPGNEQDFAFESIRLEPTEAMPNGLPTNGVLQLESSDSSVAIAPGGGAFAAEDLGTQLAMRERPELFPYMNENPMPAKFSLAQRRTIMVSVFVGEQVAATYVLNDFRGSDGKLVSLAELPQGFRDLVEKSKKEAREAFKGIPQQGVGTGGGSNIPPVP